ncbi:UDP-N-acetylmuramate dehydrogenase [Marinomonas algarum]|uniref:UDP-N-acetylenolpyruvoylglucosamine reductase n=1 Tax=Marinomonas algarum TaxID=2883105 RepID=A0A9X1IMG5_9GAMM|nr:UDP-N-acetylmuramate dehydrogenase [Marinomonas algarum]MCB5161870.1 UDP-N-acetylmuramate dehydrogenase [Marinomonas algarum]
MVSPCPDINMVTFDADLSIERHVSLLPYNTFRFDYCAEYFAVADSVSCLSALLKWAKKHHHPVTMLGGGSNLLLTNDILGLVIINKLSGMQATVESDNTVTLAISAGERWHAVVAYAVEHRWYGIENLALIPGTAGAAPVQNIGAYGVEIKDVLKRVQVIDVQNSTLHWLEAGECGFSYRDSFFKQHWKAHYFIVSIELTLRKEPALTLHYGGLSAQLEETPTLKSVFDLVCKVRREKLPDPDIIANAGSFFKNPVVDVSEHARLKRQFPNLVSFPFQAGYKLAAGWLIDQAGWKGKCHRGVGVYSKQALVLINQDEKQADALLELEALIQHSVQSKYGVRLEREPVRLPAAEVC